MGVWPKRNIGHGVAHRTHLISFGQDLAQAGLEFIADWQEEPYRKGVVYYLREGRVRGVLLCNVWEQVDAARALIREPGPVSGRGLDGQASNLNSRPEIPENER
jgi:hypothetical protein